MGGFATGRLGWYGRSRMGNGEEGSTVPRVVAVICEDRSVLVVAPMEVQNWEEGSDKQINNKLKKYLYGRPQG